MHFVPQMQLDPISNTDKTAIQQQLNSFLRSEGRHTCELSLSSGRLAACRENEAVNHPDLTLGSVREKRNSQGI